MSEHPKDVRELAFQSLREANVARQAAWCPDQLPDLSFRGNELAGETGEVCNVIKKLERERQGWRGSRDTVEHLAEELADVVICADLVAMCAGIDLDAAVAAKFNATSEKVGLLHRLARPHPAPATDGESERLRAELAVSDACNRGLVRLNEAVTARAEKAEAALAARPAVEHDRAIEEARIREDERDRLYAASIQNQNQPDMKYSGHFYGMASARSKWLRDQGAMLPADRQQARDGQSGGGA